MPGGLQSIVSQRVRQDWSNLAAHHSKGKKKRSPSAPFCLIAAYDECVGYAFSLPNILSSCNWSTFSPANSRSLATDFTSYFTLQLVQKVDPKPRTANECLAFPWPWWLVEAWDHARTIRTLGPNRQIRKSVVVVVQSLSCVWFSATPWTAACQASLSFTISWSLLKLKSIESMRPSNHLIPCRPLLLFLPSIGPSIRESIHFPFLLKGSLGFFHLQMKKFRQIQLWIRITALSFLSSTIILSYSS